MDEYYIEFNTEIDPPNIVTTKVTIGLETIKDMEKPMRVDLCDHPLYRELQQYVLANPRKFSR